MSKGPKRFAQRYGHVPVRDTVQLEQMDDDLRVALWNHLSKNIWGSLVDHEFNDIYISHNQGVYFLLRRLWCDYFIRPEDEFPSANYGYRAHAHIKKDFFNSEWYVPYEIIEEILKYWPLAREEKFIQTCNAVLETHMSAYRITGHILAPIIEKEQIDAINEAINGEQDSVRMHLEEALKLLSDKTQADYRNSIKESVSAVESKIKLALNTDNVSFSKGLNQLAERYSLHDSLKGALIKLYGYRGDVAAHGKIKSKIIKQEEAIFTLVTCSAFVSYLTAKEARHGKDSLN